MWRTNCRRGKTMNITYVNRDKKANAAITGAGRVLALTSRNCRKSKKKAKANVVAQIAMFNTREILALNTDRIQICASRRHRTNLVFRTYLGSEHS